WQDSSLNASYEDNGGTQSQTAPLMSSTPSRTLMPQRSKSSTPKAPRQSPARQRHQEPAPDSYGDGYSSGESGSSRKRQLALEEQSGLGGMYDKKIKVEEDSDIIEEPSNQGFHTGDKDRNWREFHTGEISGSLHNLHTGDKDINIQGFDTGSYHSQDYNIQTGEGSVYTIVHDTESAGFESYKNERDNGASVATPQGNVILYNDITEVPEPSVVLEDYPCHDCKMIFPTLACMEYHTQVVHRFFC
ncbi:unnamed protein product, partial [Owenia fusiformis]